MLSGGSNNVELSEESFKIPLPSLDQFQNLLKSFLAKIHIFVIHNHARHTHDLVPVLQILKMADIIYMGRHIGILRGDPLGRLHQIRTHGAR